MNCPRHLGKLLIGSLLFTAPVVLGCKESHDGGGSAGQGGEGGAGAGGGENGGAAAEPELRGFPQLTILPQGKPVISSGVRGQPIFPADPSVYLDEEGYHLFFTTVFCKAKQGYYYSWDPAELAACDITDVLGTIAYAFSPDRGRTWSFRSSPVVLPATEGWDSGDIETASVARIGDRLILAYSVFGEKDGEMMNQRYEIGAAELELDGRTIKDALMDESTLFSRRPEPLLENYRDVSRFGNNVQEPSLVVNQDGLDLYTIGLGLSEPKRPIGDPNQEIWSIGLSRARFDLELNLVSRDDEILLPYVNISEVHRVGGELWLFSTTLAGDEHEGEDLELRISSDDGDSWSDPTPLLSHDTADFDNWGIMAPTVAFEPERIVVFYTAWQKAEQACFPVPEEGRFGMPHDEGCLFTSVARAEALRLP